MAKPVKSKGESSAKIARTEANKARRTARLRRKAQRRTPDRKARLRRERRKRQADRAHALGYGSHRHRRKVEKANAARPPRSNAAHDIRPGEAVA